MAHDARRTHVAAGVPEGNFGQFDMRSVGCAADCLRTATGIGPRNGIRKARPCFHL